LPPPPTLCFSVLDVFISATDVKKSLKALSES
jgi:hypothetical protein